MKIKISDLEVLEKVNFPLLKDLNLNGCCKDINILEKLNFKNLEILT